MQNLDDEHREHLVVFGKQDKIEVLKAIEELANDAKEQAIRAHWKFENPLSEKKVILRDVFGKIMTWVERFMTIGDLIANCNPVHAALPWAGLKFILNVRNGQRSI